MMQYPPSQPGQTGAGQQYPQWPPSAPQSSYSQLSQPLPSQEASPAYTQLDQYQKTQYAPPPPMMPPPSKQAPRGPWMYVAVGLIVGLFMGLIIGIPIGVNAGGQSTATSSQSSLSEQQTSSAALTATAIYQANLEQTQLPTAPPDTPVPTQPPNPRGEIGVPQTSGNWLVTVNSIKPTPGDEFDTPKAGDQYIAINLTVKNVGTSNNTMADIDFTLRDSQGDSFDSVVLNGHNEPTGDVIAGQQVRGDLVYEVPKSLHTFVLLFDDSFDASQAVQWNLSL